MWKLMLGITLLGTAFLVLDRGRREQVVEQAKDLSDVLVSGMLRLTSEFGSELTYDGAAEQEMWREQRLRDLRFFGKVGRA